MRLVVVVVVMMVEVVVVVMMMMLMSILLLLSVNITSIHSSNSNIVSPLHSPDRMRYSRIVSTIISGIS